MPIVLTLRFIAKSGRVVPAHFFRVIAGRIPSSTTSHHKARAGPSSREQSMQFQTRIGWKNNSDTDLVGTIKRLSQAHTYGFPDHQSSEERFCC
jgi:hypothetical protein